MGLLGYVIQVLSGWGGTAADVVLFTVLVAGSAAACVAAGRSAARLPRRLLGAAILAYGFSSVSYAAVPDAAQQFPSIYDLGLFAFYPLVIGALVPFLRAAVVLSSRSLWIDCGAGALAAMALGAAVVNSGIDSLVAAGQFAYLLGDLAVLGFLATALALGGWRAATGMRLLAAAALVLVVADGVYARSVEHGMLSPGTVSLVLWPTALLLIAAGTFPRSDVRVFVAGSWSRILVPVSSAMVCVPVGFLSARGDPAHVIAAAGVVLVLVRVILSLVQNGRLLSAAKHAAISDSLTGLPNRRLLLDRLEQALARRTRHGGQFGLLFIDLDDFKTVNDTLGHAVGDRVLISVSQRLQAAVRGEDTVARVACAPGVIAAGSDTIARLGGDEFAVLSEGLREPRDIAVIAERLLQSLRAPLLIDEHELALGASIGTTISDGDDSRGAMELLRDADTAMYEAKRAGRGVYQIFEDDMHRQVVAHAELVRELRCAVSQEELRLLYQPQLDLCTGRMSGVEALVRWQHPQRGLLTPDAFIPVAERSGTIIAIDNWVLREACTQMRSWDQAGLAPFSVAVNVSATRLTTAGFAETVAEVLRQTGADPARLEIELTETVAVDHDFDAICTINALRDLGVKVAIDDFGVGHSALSRLQSFPIDRLKIDRSFVASLSKGGGEQSSIPAAMIAMAHSLGLHVVAEGIETEAHLAALQALGCECGQGYLFSRPVPPQEITHFQHNQATSSPWAQKPAARTAIATEGFIRVLLAELQRVTGLETTYLTRIEPSNSVQEITHSRNTGKLDIPEGLAVDWNDTVCRLALEQSISYTDDVPTTFPESQAAVELGLQTYITVPLTDADGCLKGTLCGASSNRVALGPETLRVMEAFAALISQASEPQAPLSSIPTAA